MWKRSIFIAVLSVLSARCEIGSVGESEPFVHRDIEGVEMGHGMILLGDKLEDPYTVENMTKAFKSVYPDKSTGAVSTTDLYVRFLPKNQGEYDLLESLGAVMIDHPVDYQVVREGDYYHDPSIPEDAITWQYAVVKPSFPFPSGVRFEILDECFISEHQIPSKVMQDVDWSAVERESFRLTGNEAIYVQPTKATSYPRGRITVLDDKYSSEPIGIKGVKVSCNVFVKFANAFTDENGCYSMDRCFSSNPRYRIVFKNAYGFAQGFNLILVPASFSTLGKHSPDGVDCTVDKYSDRILFTRCVVNNAAYEYYKACTGEAETMTMPPANLRIWNFQHLAASSAVMLQQGAFIESGLLKQYLGEYIPLVKLFLPDITLGLDSCVDYSDIYNVTIHELAHASHYMVVGNAYWDEYINFILTSFVTSGFVTYGTGNEEKSGYCAVGESWAYYMQTRLYKDRYPKDVKSFGTTYWFHPQIFLNLDERGLNRFKLFRALTPEVTDMESLKESLLYLYPEMKTSVNQAFDRYK